MSDKPQFFVVFHAERNAWLQGEAQWGAIFGEKQWGEFSNARHFVDYDAARLAGEAANGDEEEPPFVLASV